MKKVIGVLSILLLGASAWAVPLQWTSATGGNDHWYEVVEAPQTTWDSARAAALTMWHDGLQAHLATVSSQEELDFLVSVVQAQGLGEMYIGGYQNPVTETDPQAGWTWVNGEGAFPGVDSAAPFANWNDREPNDAYGPGSEQWLGINHAEGAFNDEGNLDLIYGFVVEYDPDTISDVPDAGGTAALLTAALGFGAMLSRRLRK